VLEQLVARANEQLTPFHFWPHQITLPEDCPKYPEKSVPRVININTRGIPSNTNDEG